MYILDSSCFFRKTQTGQWGAMHLGYVKDEEGALRIHVFMASTPSDGEDQEFRQESLGRPRGKFSDLC